VNLSVGELTATLRRVFNFGSHAMKGGSGGSHAVAGSGGEAVSSMVDANDERWEKLFALSAMAVDTSAEWSEGPSAAAGGAVSKRRRTGDTRVVWS